MSRRICVTLYRELVRLRPDWHHEDDDKGNLKVVMTGAASDPPGWQPLIRNKTRREALAKKFRNVDDPLQIVLVRDMWLTGFDAPSLHTMYVDKPMRGHGLMQAIARVNRVFRDKPGGLVVDYLGLAHELKRALATYTESGGGGKTALDQEEAVAVMLEKYEICCGLFHGFDRAKWITGTSQERLSLLPGAQEHILAQENGKDRCVQSVRELSQAFALAVPHEDAIRIRDEVAFFQAVQSVLAKRAATDARPEEELDHAVRQIISRAVASEGVIDIFAAAGLEKPDLSILSEEFLAEVRGMPQHNLAVELLQKLLKGEVATRQRKNVVQARSFAQMLEQTLHRYQNRAVEAAQVIEELIQLARELREATARGEKLGLSEDELAFYDALETNDSAVQVLGDETLRGIARELVETVRGNVTIDWTLRENVRANLRRLVKRTLRRHGYPPDKTGESDPDGTRTGRGVIRRLGGVSSYSNAKSHPNGRSWLTTALSRRAVLLTTVQLEYASTGHLPKAGGLFIENLLFHRARKLHYPMRGLFRESLRFVQPSPLQAQVQRLGWTGAPSEDLKELVELLAEDYREIGEVLSES